MQLQGIATFTEEKEQPKNTIQKLNPEMLDSALSHDTIKLLTTLNRDIEHIRKKTRNKKAHLEIYGSFVLYYAMILLGIKPNRKPRDLDLIIEIPDMIFARHGILTELLKEYKFEVTENNEHLSYIKLQRPRDSMTQEPGSYEMSITLALKGYAPPA
jgi:hypothetical protein